MTSQRAGRTSSYRVVQDQFSPLCNVTYWGIRTNNTTCNVWKIWLQILRNTHDRCHNTRKLNAAFCCTAVQTWVCKPAFGSNCQSMRQAAVVHFQSRRSFVGVLITMHSWLPCRRAEWDETAGGPFRSLLFCFFIFTIVHHSQEKFPDRKHASLTDKSSNTFQGWRHCDVRRGPLRHYCWKSNMHRHLSITLSTDAIY